jgi:hypothetical protein
METIMINRYITAAILVTTLSCSHLAIAKFIRVSDSAQVDDLASETMTVWDIDNFSGKLQGAFNVNVGGTLWDVVFRDGTFNSVFSDAEAATIDVRTEREATDFAEALLDSVFVDGSGPGLLFASRPDFTRGCEHDDCCIAVTSFEREVAGPFRNERRARNAVNFFNGSLVSDVEFSDSDKDFTLDRVLVYAKWTKSNVT